MSLKIGIFDSGIGGLSILKELLNLNVNCDYYYCADSEFSPYGNKSEKLIENRSLFLTELLIKENVDLIIVACNTATAFGIKELREKYSIPFVGIEPFVKLASRSKGDSKSLLIATKGTINSKRFIDLKYKYDTKNRITPFAAYNLASTIENYFSKKINYVQLKEFVLDLFKDININQYSNIILGCTHYPLIANELEKILKIKTICPSKMVAKRVKDLLSDKEFNVNDLNLYFLRTPVLTWTKTTIDKILKKDI